MIKKMKKGLAQLVVVLSVSAISNASSGNDALTPEQMEMCEKWASQLADSLYKHPYSEAFGTKKYEFTEQMGRCFAEKFHRLAPPHYRLLKHGDKYWLVVAPDIA